jgi:hypothetical protein
MFKQNEPRRLHIYLPAPERPYKRLQRLVNSLLSEFMKTYPTTFMLIPQDSISIVSHEQYEIYVRVSISI